MWARRGRRRGQERVLFERVHPEEVYGDATAKFQFIPGLATSCSCVGRRFSPAHSIAQFAKMALSDQLPGGSVPRAVISGFVFVCRQLYNTCEGLIVLNPYGLHRCLANAWSEVSQGIRRVSSLPPKRMQSYVFRDGIGTQHTVAVPVWRWCLSKVWSQCCNCHRGASRTPSQLVYTSPGFIFRGCTPRLRATSQGVHAPPCSILSVTTPTPLQLSLEGFTPHHLHPLNLTRWYWCAEMFCSLTQSNNFMNPLAQGSALRPIRSQVRPTYV